MRKLWLTLVAALCCTGAICQTNNTPLFSRFTVSNAGNSSAILKWTVSCVEPGEYFIVEKSADGIRFETMSAIASGTMASDTNFSVTDNAVGNGMIYYRIRISEGNGNLVYSKMVSTSATLLGDFRFYPNPVDKLLIVRSAHPVSIQVLDAYGIVWFSQALDAGLQIINVSTLQKGNYILKATDKETNNILSEQLIKN